MTAEQMWNKFIALHPEAAGEVYQAWCYGSDAADELAELTVKGIKTATASAYQMYVLEAEELPKEGEYSVVLYTDDTAACIIRTSRVYVVPFIRVSEEQAWREGEGDRSLAYWRAVHEDFFAQELAAAGLCFTQDMDVVCEEFSVVYPL